ncbi:hypothetical protein DFH06DRAFT_1328025 [Mycena polygramma]|nr:hypothetical protein DFH06DRAFT_1328025 [Mycena polygramma]
MSDTEDNSTLYSETSSHLLVDDATTDTEVEPPSPNGSIKAMYVRSRPTSMDGSIIEFPAFAPELDFTQFGMTPAVTHATTPGSLAAPPFPPPPLISMPPPGKNRRYARSIKSLYTGDGTGTSLKTNRATVIPVKAVPRDLTAEPATPPPKRSGWRALKKIIPGLFPRPTTRAPQPLETNVGGTNIPAAPPVHTRSTSFSAVSTFGRTRTLSIRSFKSSKSKGKARAVGVGNIPPVPVRAAPRARVHSFSGYLTDSELGNDEDETDPEMTLIGLEALATALKLNERYEFTAVDPSEIGLAL